MLENTVKLGLMPPLTGVVGMYGAEISHAGQIACDEINESGGVLGRPLELVIEDDGSLPESAAAAAAKLVNHHHCVAIIGNLLSNSRIAVAYQVAEPNRIPYLNFSFYEGSILSRYFFHFAALPNQQIDQMIPYMRNKYGPRMFFAGNNYEWPRGSIDAAKLALKKSGGQVVGEEYYPIGVGNDDINRLLDQLAESGADVFVPYFAGADQVHLLTRFTEKGLKNKMAVVMGHYDEIMASRLPPEVRADFYSSNTYFMTLDTPENKEYLARLSNQPGISGIWPQGNGILTNFGEGAYLCVKAFAKAANQAGSLDSEALINALETIHVSGPQGTVQMDPVTHHAQVNTYLSRCQVDGSFAIIERFGAIPPIIPERYQHLQICKQFGQEDINLQSRMLVQMSEAVLLVNADDGVIVYANPGAGRMFGYELSEMIGKHFSILFAFTEKSQAETTSFIGDMLSRKGIWQGETENITKDGKRFWCAASISVFTHPKYSEVWMILSKDITERKQMEDALNEAVSRNQAIMDTASDAIIVTHLNGTIQMWNRKAEEFFGYGTDEAIGQVMHTLIFPERFHERSVEWLRQLAETGAAPLLGKSLELIACHRDKTEFPIELSISVTDIRGVCYITSIIRDVTERNHARQELQRINQALLTITTCNAALIHATDELQLLHDMCQIIVRNAGYMMSWVGFVEHDEQKTVRPMAHGGFEQGYLERAQVTWADDPRGQGPTGTAIRTQKPALVKDTLSDPAYRPWRDHGIKLGYRSILALPLISFSQVFGALTIYSPDIDAFSENEIELLDQLANDLAFGIMTLRTRKAHELSTERLMQSMESSITAVAAIVEMRDRYTAGHQRRVADLSKAIAHELGLSESEIHGIYLAAAVHDLGKIHVPAEILTNPDRLSDIEFQLVKTHAKAGYDILKDIDFPWPIAQMVYQHHEWLDGTGYPNGLKDSEILFGAKIITVADTVEAMSSHRPYRPGLGIDAALEEISHYAGVRYDRKIVDTCIKLFRERGYNLAE